VSVRLAQGCAQGGLSKVTENQLLLPERAAVDTWPQYVIVRSERGRDTHREREREREREKSMTSAERAAAAAAAGGGGGVGGKVACRRCRLDVDRRC